MKTMGYKGYLGSVECSFEDNCLFGQLLHVNDLVNFEADTPAALQEAFEQAVDDYLETCKELGKEPDKAFKGSFNVRVTPELHKAAVVIATQQEISLNEFVAQTLREKIDGHNEIHHHHEPHFHIEASVNEPLDFAEMGSRYSTMPAEGQNE
ncbi:MAG: type II toxin-antitoxin system HicB family antitoxin [Verrucomicrobiota bacterium]